MSQKNTYIQCHLRHVNGVVDYAWIPERFAQKGKFLKIRNNGQWEDHWQVVEVYGKKQFTEIELKERDYLHQRRASDV